MKNILSYTNDPTFSGKDILDWIKEQIQNDTSHVEYAKWLENSFDIKENRQYKLYWKLAHDGQPNTRRPYLLRCKEYD